MRLFERDNEKEEKKRGEKIEDTQQGKDKQFQGLAHVCTPLATGPISLLSREKEDSHMKITKGLYSSFCSTFETL